MNGMKATNIVTDLKFNNFFLNEKLFLIWVEIKHFLSRVHGLHSLMFYFIPVIFYLSDNTVVNIMIFLKEN